MANKHLAVSHCPALAMLAFGVECEVLVPVPVPVVEALAASKAASGFVCSAASLLAAP